MKREELVANIRSKKSFLCVGLDVDIEKMPEQFKKEEDPIFSFNKFIIDQTRDFAVAYKPNLAFYERYGLSGLESLKKTLNYIPNDIFTIADAKRGDIGNTAAAYNKAFNKNIGGDFGCDAVTVAPYMGEDSVRPFMENGLWAIVLGLTSNKGAEDFQKKKLDSGQYVYEEVLRSAASWGSPDELMMVVGATNGKMIKSARAAAPDHFFLVPGIGAQGGSLEDVCQYGLTADIGLLVNSSRGIIYSKSPGEAAELLQKKMAAYI